MIYAYDQALQLPTVDLYDTQMMAMAINAAKDMYDRGQEQVKNFYTKYGDFMSPFAKDMERYGQMMGNVRNLINDAYARGIDLVKSPEGRALIQRAVYSVDPYEYNLMRSNAKTGYQYLDAIQKLRSQGKYSEAQELFDIAQTGGKNFSDFSTFDREGAHVWDRTSPIEATSLLDLTFNSYKNRTPRDLTVADFVESNGLKPGMFDRRYQYTGYLDSDLMKVAPGAAMSIAADPRAAYFRDLAEQKVAARGGNYTQADVDAQFYRDIADANKWALVDPTKKVDEYAMQAQKAADAIKLEGIRAANDIQIANIKAGNGPGGQITGQESWTKRQRDNIKEGMNVYANAVNKAKLGTTFAGAKKQLIAEGVSNPSAKQVSERIAKNKQSYIYLINQMTNSKGLTGENLSYLNAYYNAYQTNITGEDAKTALALAADLADPESINDIQSGHKRLPIMFEPDGNLNLTRQREAAYAGVSLTKGSITNQLYKYLSDHGIEGFIPNRDVTVNRMPYGNYGVWDINFTGRFKKQDLAKFKGAGSNEFYNAIANAGGRYVTKGGKVIEAEEGDDKGKIKWSDIEYIDLPVSRTIDERQHTSWQIDDYHRRRVYGQNNAAKAASTSND